MRVLYGVERTGATTASSASTIQHERALIGWATKRSLAHVSGAAILLPHPASQVHQPCSMPLISLLLVSLGHDHYPLTAVCPHRGRTQTRTVGSSSVIVTRPPPPTHKPATRPEHHSLSAPHPTPWRDKPQLRPHRVCIRRTPLGRDRNQAITDVSWCNQLLYHVCSPTRSPCTEVAARTLAPDPPRAAMLLLHAAHRFGGACSSLRSSRFRNRPPRAAGAED